MLTATSRNIIAHRYDEVRPEILWGVIASNIPILLEQLEVLLPPLSNE
ncbi:MAG: HepT-like ribonuclease domain-containing protein [Cyanobacteriota bacterium]|nr:HepT-like ribonuclease domain-containing protein [Cyanobacteriota bacterium]